MAAVDSAARPPSRWSVKALARLDAVAAVLIAVGSLALVATMQLSHAAASVAAITCLVLATAVAARRRSPMIAALAAVVAALGYERASQDHYGAFAAAAVLLTTYSVGSHAREHRRARAALVLVVGFAASAGISASISGFSVGTTLSSWLLVMVVPVVTGVLVAKHRVLSDELARAAQKLRAEQEPSAVRATVQERNRVARELHDVVTHSVSVMVVQAGAARLVAPADPTAASAALVTISEVGRETMIDVRRIVGVLRRDLDADFGSGTGVADLERLVQRVSATGVVTHLDVLCLEALPPAIDLLALRVVQEALTNVVKHAGVGATASVSVRVDATGVNIEVVNTGTSERGTATGHGGHGLSGMRERLGAFGGTLEHGPRSAGGYAVRVWIPLADERQASTDDRISAQPLQPARSHVAQHWDVAVACMWLIAMEVEAATSSARSGSWALNAVVVAALAAAALWRRRAPLTFVAVAGLLALTVSSGLTSTSRSTVTGAFVLAVPLYTVARWAPLGRALTGLTLWTCGAALAGWIQHAAIGGVLGAVVMGIVLWSVGRVWRRERQLVVALSETNARLAAERDKRAQTAVITARTDIARELHGQVAGSIVAMVVEAESARSRLAEEPVAAIDSIRAVEETGREALSQLRGILGVLRSDASLDAVGMLPVQDPRRALRRVDSNPADVAVPA